MSKSASGLRVSLSQNESMPKYPSLGQSRKIQKQDYSWLYSNTSAKIKVMARVIDALWLYFLFI